MRAATVDRWAHIAAETEHLLDGGCTGEEIARRVVGGKPESLMRRLAAHGRGDLSIRLKVATYGVLPNPNHEKRRHQ